MSTSDLGTRIEQASCSVDGVVAILDALDANDTSSVERVVWACRDLLSRVNDDLDEIGAQVSRLAVDGKEAGA